MLSLPEMRKKQVIVVFSNEGDKFSFSNDNIVIKDKDGKIKHQSTCYKLFMIIIVGNISITSGILQRAKKFGFSICLMTRSMKVYQVICENGNANTLLRKRQYEYTGLELGKRITDNKIQNQLLAINKIRGKNEFDKESIVYLRNYQAALKDASSINEIMGYEGAAARCYFERIFANIDFKGRKPRVKCDYVNATLDIGYNILFNFIDALLTSFGFDTYYGVLHRCFYRRKSLVCDLVEPFRPLIDLTVRKAINLKQISQEDFEVINYRYVLSYKNSPKYVSIFMKIIMDHKEDIFSYVQQYYRAFMKNVKIEDFPFYKI
jgi:CRISP-associated protein Cas1